MRHRGFALAATLLALLLVAALVAGVIFAAVEETRIGAASAARERTLTAAESAIEAAVAGGEGWLNQKVGLAGARQSTIDWSGVSVAVTTTRLDSSFYWIVARAPATPSNENAARQVGALLRVQSSSDSSITGGRTRQKWWSELF